jgi:hypothetical protein
MNTALKIIQRKIKAVQNAQDDVNSAMGKIFPEGKKIVFKRDNMRHEAPAVVIWAQMINGWAELRITNTKTNKDRTISLSDVVEI